MANYSEVEKLNIMNKAAESGWSAWDMMWAGMGMAMWMNMANNMQETPKQAPAKEDWVEAKLEKIIGLLEKWLISQEDYDAKKAEIIASL
jgi:membrane protease subunit (stomatin/prohibitin family)